MRRIKEYIIENYTYEAGVRKLKEKLYEIIREVNLNYAEISEAISNMHIFPKFKHH